MRFISTPTHAILDYVVGVLLIVAPFLLGFANGGAAMWVPIILGIGTIGYSLLTDYRYSAARLIPMPAHLGLDLGAGILLAVSPWLFGFADLIWWPHVLVGLFEICAALTTHTRPEQGELPLQGARDHHGKRTH